MILLSIVGAILMMSFTIMVTDFIIKPNKGAAIGIILSMCNLLVVFYLIGTIK